MTLDPNARALAQYFATPNLNLLSGNDPSKVPLPANKSGATGEKLALLTALQNVWGTDTSYLTANTTVNPGTLNVNGLATAGSATAQAISPPGLVAGTGTIS